jgi:TolA-binding protein
MKIKISWVFTILVGIIFSNSGLSAVNTNPDQDFYAKVIQSYRQGDSTVLNKSVRLLIKNHPDSVHADNALYLNGLLALSKGQYKRAIKNFVLLQRFYPRANKLPAALIGKGIAYRKLGKLDKAEQAFKVVQDKFVGSPEFFQAGVQIKLLRQE